MLAAAVAALGACGGSDDDTASGTAGTASGAETPAGATSADTPGGDIPVAPINNAEMDNPNAEGTMAAAMHPGDWFEFEYGYSARIESVRAAQPGEIETEAQGGGASIINVQVHYNGDDPTSNYSWFQLDTALFNQLSG